MASHVHKITGNLTICSIVCSVKKKKKKDELCITGLFLDKSTGCHRLPSLRDSKAYSVPWYYNQQELSAHFFFNILTTLDYFLQSKTKLLWNVVDISIMGLHSRPMYVMELHHVDDGSLQIVWSSITANCRAPWIDLWVMDLHKSNGMELHNSNHESQ